MNDFPYSIVGFDLDGTLVDSSRDLAAAVNHALVLAGRDPMPVDQITPLIGRGSRHMLNQALAHEGGISDEEFKPLFEDLIAFYKANLTIHTRPYPGCEAALDKLASHGCKLAVVTNKLEDLARDTLEQLGMLGRFEIVIGGDTMGPGKAKPSAAPIEEMIVGCGGGRAVFVGDTSIDIDAAHAAGIDAIAVSFGFNDVNVHEMGAEAVVDNYAMLIDTLASG